MNKNTKHCHKLTMSEIRGIGLVILGIAALLYYYSWWMTDNRLASPWLLVGFIIALFYGVIQILGNWAVYLATHRRVVMPSTPINGLTVDVFVTAYDESPALIEKCLTAACAMHGDHKTWLLDDGNNPLLARIANRLGAGYLTRNDHKDAKAGNLNAALARTDGDVVVIFDIDHVPQPNFLQQTLGHFSSSEIGFVQVMLTFGNSKEGWVARAASDSSLDFYNPTSIGSDGLHSATLVGSNALIRREALESIGGYKPGLAEDLATSIALHAEGWQSVYIAEPLAPGMAPPDLAAWFTQQLKWARGVFELFLTDYPRFFFRLKIGQRISYAVRMTYYWIGIVVFAHLLVTITSLLKGTPEALQSYLMHLSPLGAMIMGIRLLALRRWRHWSLPVNVQWKPLLLVYVTWPIYSLAWIMAMLRFPLGFRPTPKKMEGRVNPLWLMPQAATTAFLIAGMEYLYRTAVISHWLVWLFAGGQAAVQLLLLAQWLDRSMLNRIFRRRDDLPKTGRARPYPITSTNASLNLSKREI